METKLFMYINEISRQELFSFWHESIEFWNRDNVFIEFNDNQLNDMVLLKSRLKSQKGMDYYEMSDSVLKIIIEDDNLFLKTVIVGT